MKKKLNTISLSGLMIGPVLGSGIVLLPPIAIDILGDKAIIAWIIIMLLSIVFAYVFTRMSLLAPSNEGVSVIIGERLGQSFRELSSNYLTAAVCFGPVAVVFTASDFVCGMLLGSSDCRIIVTFFLLLMGILVILMGITAIGNITLILSSLTAVLLVVSSCYSLIKQPVIHFPNGMPGIKELGSALLLLFWAMIGWEIVGNYIEEVNNPRRTIMRSMKISLIAVILIYLLSAFALQNNILQQAYSKGISNMSLLLVPLFGKFSLIIMGIIATGLCYSTLIMILGAVTRQIAARAENGKLPAFFKQKFSEKSPKRALFTLTTFHCLIIVLIHFNLVSIQWVVGTANTFFICNALLGLAAGFKCVKGFWLKSFIVILLVSLGIMLTFSPVAGWVLLALVSFLSVYQNNLNAKNARSV